MSALAEIAVAIGAFLMQMTLHAAVLAVTPIRFLTSARFRTERGEQWKNKPFKKWWDISSGTFVLLIFVFAVAVWGYVFTRPEPTLREHEAFKAEIKKLFLERVQRDRAADEEHEAVGKSQP